MQRNTTGSGERRDRDERESRECLVLWWLVIACVAVGWACDSKDPQTADTGGTTSSRTPVALVAVYEDVAFYPACGNETLHHQGVAWYPIVQVGFQPMAPELQDLGDAVLAVERERWTSRDPQGLARVGIPGPGDDVGTMAVWADGVGRWASDSGRLDVWMVDDKVEYSWVC
jgi:hypothetical protein